MPFLDEAARESCRSAKEVFMAKIVHVEPTPNPLAFKVVLDQKVTTSGSRHYSKKEEAFANPFIARFFDIHGVQSVFIMDNFITLNKTPGGIWDYIFFQVNEVLMSTPVITPVAGEGEKSAGIVSVATEFDKLNREEKLALINQVIDESIRPGLARDGGGLELLDLEENILKVRYQGACGSCPSSTAGTLNYISNLLQSRVSPHLTIIPA